MKMKEVGIPLCEAQHEWPLRIMHSTGAPLTPALCEADYVFPSPYQGLALTGNHQKWEENNFSPCPFPSLYQEGKSLSKAL